MSYRAFLAINSNTNTPEYTVDYAPEFLSPQYHKSKWPSHHQSRITEHITNMSNHLLAASINTIGQGQAAITKTNPKFPVSQNRKSSSLLMLQDQPSQINKGICWAGVSPHFSHSRTQADREAPSKYRSLNHRQRTSRSY